MTRPDIIVIITDQQRYDTIAALGASHTETPNLDRLAARGVSFSNCHITATSCVPCRASLFSGYYPHTTGILSNDSSWSRTWVSQIAEAGYHTVNIGKMHTIPYDAPCGFHERFIVENKDRFYKGRWHFDEWDKALAANGLKKQQRDFYRQLPDYGERLGAFVWELPAHLHSDHFVGGMARWWLETKPVDEPLFMVIGFPGPHPPYDPTPEAIERAMARDMPIPVLSKEERAGLPPPYVEKRRHDVEVDHDSIVWQFEPSREQLHRMRAHYTANVEMIDAEVGQILDVLERRGRLDNSIIVFTSDHGDCLGDHGLSQKWAPYDAVTRVPLIISSPARMAEDHRVDALVQLFDLGPTILEWAGVELDSSFEAQSLNPALDGQSYDGRDLVFAEQAADGNLTGTDFLTMVRSATHKLVHFKDADYGQLFDLKSDPGEVNNLWDDPASQAIKTVLHTALRDWHVDSAYRTREARSRMINPGTQPFYQP